MIVYSLLRFLPLFKESCKCSKPKENNLANDKTRTIYFLLANMWSMACLMQASHEATCLFSSSMWSYLREHFQRVLDSSSGVMNSWVLYNLHQSYKEGRHIHSNIRNNSLMKVKNFIVRMEYELWSL